MVQTFRTLTMLTLLFQNSASLNATFASRSYVFFTRSPKTVNSCTLNTLVVITPCSEIPRVHVVGHVCILAFCQCCCGFSNGTCPQTHVAAGQDLNSLSVLTFLQCYFFRRRFKKRKNTDIYNLFSFQRNVLTTGGNG